jgi:chromosome segregation ATPase
MCKKACVAALAVLVGVGIVSLSWPKFRSHVKLQWNRMWTGIENKVSPETELDRLELVLKEMKDEDRRYEDQIAKMDLAVDKADARVKELEGKQTALKERIDALNAALTSVTSGETVQYKNKERRRTDVDAQLKLDARRYLDGQAALKTAKDGLKIKRETLAQAQARLVELRAAREKAQVKLEQLRNQLMEERRAQAAGERGDDGGKMAQWNKDFEAAQDRVALMRKKRQAPTTSAQGPIEKLEAQEKGDGEVDAFLRGLNNPQPVGAQNKR